MSMIERTRQFTDKVPGSGAEMERELSIMTRTFNDHDQARRAWSTLSLKVSVVTSGAAYSVTNNEVVTVINKTIAGVTTVTLPASPLTGRVVIVKDGKGDAGVNNITITGAAGNIDGAASKVINANYGVMQFIYNGTEWNVLSAS